MPELILVRHAKSSHSDPSLDDHERPLNGRGTRNAPMMAQRLADAGTTVDRLLSSTAVRARATAEAFGAALGVAVELDDSLYMAGARDLLATALAAGSAETPPDRHGSAAEAPEAKTVMIVAHDPGLSSLAAKLSGGGIDRMKTCAVARFVWEGDSWGSIRVGTPSVVADSWTLDTPR